VTGRDHYEKRGPQEREVMRIIGDLEEEEEKEEEEKVEEVRRNKR
jgi:hypothetical protein